MMYRRAATLVLAVWLTGCGEAPSLSAYDAEIRWTSYGIPHVKAEDWESLGYGFAYATATDALSASGRGMLLGNPHYPWRGPSRFHLIHTTIPGEVDVMGTSLLNTNRVAIGFNQDIAWTHTVSTAMRFTLYQLTLNPEKPLRIPV